MSDSVKRKVILIGDGAVGKTSLIRRFVMDKFDDRYITTIGTKVSKKELALQKEDGVVGMTLMIWDILGQQGYTSIQRLGYRGSEGAILVCDYTRKETLESLEKYWVPELRGVVGTIPMVFAGNKVDLAEKHMFSEAELSAMAQKYDSPFISTSAMTGAHVENMFSELGSRMISMSSRSTDDQFVHAGSRDSMTIVQVADWLMGDFCDNFGGVENGMPVVRKQFERAGVDVNVPRKDGLLRVVDMLAEVESDFKSKDEVLANKNRRKKAINGAV